MVGLILVGIFAAIAWIFGTPSYAALTNFLFWWYIITTFFFFLYLPGYLRTYSERLNDVLFFITLRGLFVFGAYSLKIAYVAEKQIFDIPWLLIGGIVLLIALAIGLRFSYNDD